MTSTLSLLIQRLEAATEGSRELDGNIAIAITHIGELVDPLSARHAIAATALPYTTSLDAAMTLVPKDASWQVTAHVSGEPFRADINIEHECLSAPTAALALCIASFKSRFPQDTP